MPEPKRLKPSSPAKGRVVFADQVAGPCLASTYGGWGLFRVHYIPSLKDEYLDEGQDDMANDGSGNYMDVSGDHGLFAARQKETDEEANLWRLINAKSGLEAFIKEQDWPGWNLNIWPNSK